VQQVGTENL